MPAGSMAIMQGGPIREPTSHTTAPTDTRRLYRNKRKDSQQLKTPKQPALTRFYL